MQNSEIIKTIGTVENFASLQTFCLELYNKLQLPQISLQVKNSTSSWTQSTGWLKTRGEEFLFDQIHPLLKDSVIDHLLSNLPFTIWRLRLMAMQPNTSYSWHSDPTPRIHIPIFTNEDCLFSFPDQGIITNLKANGSIYWTDTTKTHSFLNKSTSIRIHLVGIIKSE